jgi:low affinity Fe/Cu permease
MKNASARRASAPPPQPRHWSTRAIDGATSLLGHRLAVAMAITLVLLWLAAGPLVGFTDTYQLVINTATTIITFVMVFVIQHTTNRETRAMHLKLDEVIRRVGGAPELVGAESEEEEDIKRQQAEERRRAASSTARRGRYSARRT